MGKGIKLLILFLVCNLFISVASAQDYKKAIVKVPNSIVKDSPKGRVIEKLGVNQELVVIDSYENMYKVMTKQDNYGWVDASNVAITKNFVDGVVTSDKVNVRKGSSIEAPTSSSLDKGSKVYIYGKEDTFYKIKTSDGHDGYIYSDLVSISDMASANVVSRGAVSSKTQGLVNVAKSKMGSPYVYGTQGPKTFDCSGFTSYVYKNGAGITLPRSSTQQATAGKSVSRSAMEVGDLVFFATNGSSGINHVGMYIGSGKFIHASSYSRKVVIDDLNGRYSKSVRAVRRIIN